MKKIIEEMRKNAYQAELLAKAEFINAEKIVKELKSKFLADNKVPYKQYHFISKGIGKKITDQETIKRFYECEDAIEKAYGKYRELDAKAKKLREDIETSDTRKVLTSVEGCPSDEYPKISKCSKYPLRGSCNHGENDTCKWDRCEFMKYKQDPIGMGGKWICVYK